MVWRTRVPGAGLVGALRNRGAYDSIRICPFGRQGSNGASARMADGFARHGALPLRPASDERPSVPNRSPLWGSLASRGISGTHYRDRAVPGSLQSDLPKTGRSRGISRRHHRVQTRASPRNPGRTSTPRQYDAVASSPSSIQRRAVTTPVKPWFGRGVALLGRESARSVAG